MDGASQSMRGDTSSSSIRGDGEAASMRGKKTMLNAASKVVAVVEKMLLPLLDTHVGTHVSFCVSDEHSEFDLLDGVRRVRPGAMSDLDTFVEYARGLYERYSRHTGVCCRNLPTVLHVVDKAVKSGVSDDAQLLA